MVVFILQHVHKRKYAVAEALLDSAVCQAQKWQDAGGSSLTEKYIFYFPDTLILAFSLFILSTFILEVNMKTVCYSLDNISRHHMSV